MTNTVPDDEFPTEIFVAQYIENLLPIASFLTSLRGAMQREGQLGWISVHDVATVLHFRSLMHELDVLDHRRQAYRKLKPCYLLSSFSSSLRRHSNKADDVTAATPFDPEYQQLQQSLQMFDKRIRTIHTYWQEVEVLLTKALVVEDCRSRGNMYWNLPFQLDEEKTPRMGALQGLWGRYQQELQQLHGDAMFPSLSVVPQEHTWATWVRRVPNIKDSESDSPYSSVFLRQPLKSAQSQPRYIYTMGDLKAIVQQSHHCVASLRHLCQIFLVTRTNDDDTHNDGANPYTAELRGNHRHTHRRVHDHTPLVERLVGHAIQQQMEVITPTVYAHLKHTWHTQQLEWERLTKGGDGERPAKRRKANTPTLPTPEVTSEDDAQDLLLACQSVLLRTWACRHAAVLASVFNSEPCPTALSWLHLTATTTSYADALKSALRDAASTDETVDPSDRALDRIDRRIFHCKYASDLASLTLAVEHLLTAWGQIRAGIKMDDESEVRPLQAAMEDWAATCQLFIEARQAKGIVGAARSLVDEDAPPHMLSKNVDSWFYVLSSCPIPWGQKCEDCKDEHKNKQKQNEVSKLKICVACTQWRHSACCQGRTVKTDSLIASFEPLLRLFAARPLRGSRVPVPPGSWKRMEFILERHRDENTGEWQKLGLRLADAQRCADLLEQLLGYKILPWKEIEYRGLLPIQLHRPGYIIMDLPAPGESVAKYSGLQQGDVIVAVETLGFEQEGSGKLMKTHSFTVEEHSLQDVMTAFQLPCTKFRVVVQRPDENPIPAATSFWKRSFNGIPARVHAAVPDLWFCGRCSGYSGGEKSNPAPEYLCRAVVRQLASQHYAVPFCYENHVRLENMDKPFGDKQCVSFKRLDLIFTAIIQGQDLEQDRLSPLHARRLRLSWTTGDLDPRLLLCRAVDLMASGESGHDVDDSVRQCLLTDFTRFFAAWCLASGLGIEDAGGCPPFALCRSAVWKPDLCLACRLRDKPPESEICSICQSLGGVQQGRLGRFDRILLEYESKAALVGSMVILPPDDDLVESVIATLERINVPVEHFGRPVEFVVAAYIPFGLEDHPDHYEKEDVGTFFLLPVIQPLQLKFLTDRCRLGKPDALLTSEVLQKWYRNGLLDLEGVTQLTHAELVSKLNCTNFILEAIHRRIEMMSVGESRNFSGLSAVERIQPNSSALCRSAFKRKLIEANQKLMMTSDVSDFVSRVFSPTEQMHIPEPCEDFDFEIDKIIVPSRDVRLVSTATKADQNQYEISTPPDNAQNLLYTDLFFETVEARTIFEREHTADGEQQAFTSSSNRSIVLDHANATEGVSRAFPGVGWGFELLREDGGLPKVGRVDKSGVAFLSGLRSGDKLLLINGKSPEMLKPFVEFPKAFIGYPLEDLAPNKPALASLLLLRECSMADKLPGPLILRIRRSQTPTHGSSAGIGVATSPNGPPQQKPQMAAVGDRGHHSGSAGSHGALPAIQHEKKDFVITDATGGKILALSLKAGHMTDRSGQGEIQVVVETVMKGVAERGGRYLYQTSQGMIRLSHAEAEEKLLKMVSRAFMQSFPHQGTQERPPEAQPVTAGSPLVQHQADVPGNFQRLVHPPPPLPAREVQQATSLSNGMSGHTSDDKPIKHSYYQYLIERMPFSMFRSRAPLTVRDLHRCGPGEFSMTLAELGVLLHAVISQQPMLGFRLLMPRYRLRIIEEHMTRLTYLDKPDISMLRIVPDIFFRTLVRQDYLRASAEIADRPKLLCDPQFEYAVPTTPLPIDNLFEKYFEEHHERQIIEIDDAPARIRGGGPKDDGPVTLASKPANEWVGKTVFARLLVQSEGFQKPTTVIGDVVSILDAARGQVKVQVYLHWKKGAVDPYECTPLARDLREVQPDSPKWERAQQAKKFHGIQHPTGDIPRDGAERKLAEGALRPEVPLEEVLRHPFFEILRMNEEDRSKQLLRSIDSVNQPFVLIGLLPDHRKVYWHVLDRDSIYVSPFPGASGEENLVDFLTRRDACENHIESPSRAHHICTWCCDNETRKNLVFDNRNDLLNHYCAEHSIPSQGSLWTLKRVSSVQTKSNFFAALVAFVHKRFFEVERMWMSNTTTPTLDPRFVADEVPASDMNLARCWAVAKSAEREALMTLVNFMTLFDTDKFCYRVDELEEMIVQDVPEQTQHSDAGTGSSPFDQARRLLLSMANTMPKELIKEPHRHHFEARDDGDSAYSIPSVISVCQTVQGFIHAFSFILYSINNELLPEWWKSDGGSWYSAQGLLLNADLSSLILHAEAFQEAITEAIQNLASGPISAFGKFKLAPFPPDYVDLTKQIVALAEEKGIPRFSGRDEEYCYKCRDGGELYCCSFCRNVMCQNCYNSYNLPSAPADFVCHSCINGIRAFTSLTGGR